MLSIKKSNDEPQYSDKKIRKINYENFHYLIINNHYKKQRT